MSKVLYHVTMSLDGFIAAPGDDMSWLTGNTGPNETVDEVLPQIGALLLGHRTYYPATSAEGEPYGGLVDAPQFVHTKQDPSTAAAGFTFISGSIEHAVATAAAAAGGKYVAILGASTARKCLEAGLLDEILVHVAPLMLGDGVRLFDHPGGTNVRLERVKVTESPTVTNIWMRVVK
jgi:dihydrofolate reductase